MNTTFYLAQAYEKLGESGKAKELYLKVIKCNANYPWEKGALTTAKNYLEKIKN